MPGAFSPVCHKDHVPTFVEHFDEFRAKGVQLIGVVSVNDGFVMTAWQKSLKLCIVSSLLLRSSKSTERERNKTSNLNRV